MVEVRCQQRLFPLERVEMFRLARRLNMSGAPVAAGDVFLVDERFEPRNRVRRDVEELPRARAPITVDQRLRIDLEAGEHLSAVSRARAAADPVAFEHQY